MSERKIEGTLGYRMLAYSIITVILLAMLAVIVLLLVGLGRLVL